MGVPLLLFPTSELVTEPDMLRNLAEELDGYYATEDLAPVGWHLKDELRKNLRQKVRLRAHEAGLSDLKTLSERIEDFALKHHVRVS